MNRYVLTYYKKNYMRFLSHLDMQRLFRRALYKAEVNMAFTQGYNPHSIINLVQPLSLGFEAEKDYFEFETNEPVDTDTICDVLNLSLPSDIRFTACREFPLEKRNLSAKSQASDYSVRVITEDKKMPDIDSFLKQEKIMIWKRDKKTKQQVEKDVKNLVFGISDLKSYDNGFGFVLCVSCASNETLNPLQLTESLLKFSGIDYLKEDIRISRLDLLYFDENNTKVSLFD